MSWRVGYTRPIDLNDVVRYGMALYALILGDITPKWTTVQPMQTQGDEKIIRPNFDITKALMGLHKKNLKMLSRESLARKNATSLEWFVISVKKERPSKMCVLNTQNY